MSASILIVEDDDSLRLALRDNLEEEGYEVDAVESGAAARDALGRGAPDLLILDVMLPDVDGYTLCRELRAAGHRSMVLMLTARTLEDDLVAGFDAGADDYLAKPYRLKELLARVGALLRRRTARAGEAPSRFGRFTLDREARKVTCEDGGTVALTRTEFDLLALLLDHVDRAFTRDEILDAVWGKDVVVDGRTVDNFVSNLRRKLRWRAGAGFAIRTVRGVGYRMEIDR